MSRTNPSELALVAGISDLNLSGRLNALRMVILADGDRWVTVQERSSLSVNLNEFLDLLLQSSGFGLRKRRIFRHEAFAHTVLIGFHLQIC